MSSDRLKHWTPGPPGAASGNPMVSTMSVRDGSMALPSIPVIDPHGTETPTMLHPLDLNKADLSFPPVRQPSYPLRRYTRRLHGSGRRPVFLYNVSPRVYSVLWLLVLVLHLICAVYLGLVGGLHFYLLGTNLIGYLTLYGVTVDAFYLPPIGVGYFVVCGLHAFSVATIVFHSIVSHRSVFTSTQVMTRTVTTPVMRIRRMSLTALSSVEFRTQSVLERLPSPFVRVCYRTWHAITKLYDSTDINNECYYVVYVSRLLVQSLLHMHQLFFASLFLPQPRVNTAWVVLFVVNCWLPPLLSSCFRSNRPRTRLWCVCINLTLDMTALVVLACVVSYPYAMSYDWERTNFPRTLWYKDAWFIRTINEFRMLFVVTPLDFVTKIGIAFNVWRSLRVIPIMLRKTDVDDVVPAPNPNELDPLDSASNAPRPPSHADSQFSQASSQNLVVVEPSGRWSKGVLGGYVLVLFGAVVLGAHVHANSWPLQPHCKLPLQAWFTPKVACSALEYRCTEPHQTGRAAELAALFREFDPRLVSFVSIRSCPHVEIPRELRTFDNLLGIKVYQSTLVQWDERAAVTASQMDQLRFVFLIDVNMTAFPRGLMSRDFPQRLLDIEIHRTNLTSLPHELDQLWPRRMTLALEEFPFTAFPSVVPRLGVSAVSLAKSQITSVPPELFESNELHYVILNGNPLRELPANVTLGPRLTWVSADSTDLSSLPDAFAAIQVDAHETPLCAALTASTTVRPLTLQRVDCTAPMDPVAFTMYPIELEDELNG